MADDLSEGLGLATPLAAPVSKASWYESIDAFFGGLLPGGVSPVSTPFLSSAAEAATVGGVSGYGAAAGVPQYGTAPRGKRYTIEVTRYPDGTVVPGKTTPGGVALYARDYNAVKRAKRIERKLQSIFPRRARAKAKRR